VIFLICLSCYRSHRYCSDNCSTKGKSQRRKKANAKYRKTSKGRLAQKKARIRFFDRLAAKYGNSLTERQLLKSHRIDSRQKDKQNFIRSGATALGNSGQAKNLDFNLCDRDPSSHHDPRKTIDTSQVFGRTQQEELEEITRQSPPQSRGPPKGLGRCHICGFVISLIKQRGVYQ